LRLKELSAIIGRPLRRHCAVVASRHAIIASHRAPRRLRHIVSTAPHVWPAFVSGVSTIIGRCVASLRHVVASHHVHHRYVTIMRHVVALHQLHRLLAFQVSYVLGQSCVIVHHIVASHHALSLVASCATSVRHHHVRHYAVWRFDSLPSSVVHRLHRAPHRLRHIVRLVVRRHCATSLRHIVAPHRCLRRATFKDNFHIIGRLSVIVATSCVTSCHIVRHIMRHVVASSCATRTAVCGVSILHIGRRCVTSLRHIMRHIVASRRLHLSLFEFQRVAPSSVDRRHASCATSCVTSFRTSVRHIMRHVPASHHAPAPFNVAFQGKLIVVARQNDAHDAHRAQIVRASCAPSLRHVVCATRLFVAFRN
jgi:hypothetical protein